MTAPLRDELYQLLLFGHFLAIVGAVAAATLLHVALGRLRAAERVSEVGPVLAHVGRVAPTMAIWSLLLLLTGAGMTALRWSWKQPWIATAVVVLVLMQVVSLAILKPRLQAIGRRLAGVADGPLDADVAAALRAPTLHTAAQIPPALALGNMFLMVTKPALVGAVTSIVVAVGLAVAMTASKGRGAVGVAATVEG